ncbi:hypothetical protein [Leucothrix pacifica]|nr:hypothetical protein [Leucothrix pacifica]
MPSYPEVDMVQQCTDRGAIQLDELSELLRNATRLEGGAGCWLMSFSI